MRGRGRPLRGRIPVPARTGSPPMLIALALLCLGAVQPQEPSRVPGAYRGPSDEVLEDQERALRAGLNPQALADAWDRWEFWFESWRDRLLRGPAESPPLAVTPQGRYGHAGGALHRQTVLEEGVPLLVLALRDGDAAVREAAVRALGRIAAPGTAGDLLQALEDPDPAVRQAAFLALGMSGDGRALVELGDRFLGRGPAEARAFAALGLALSGRSEAVELLRLYLNRALAPEQIVGEEEIAVQGALLAAASLENPAFTSTLLRGWQRLRPAEGAAASRVRSLLLGALGATRAPEAKPILRRALAAADANESRAAALALARGGDASDLEFLAETVRSSADFQTREYALLAIGTLGTAGAGDVLASLEEITRRERQLRAAWALATGLARWSGGIEQVRDEFLYATGAARREGRLRRDEEQLRGAHALALGFFGDARAVAWLQRVARREGVYADLRGYADLAIGYLDGPDSLPFLLEEAGRGDLQRDARRGLVRGLGLLARTPATRELVRFVLDDPDPSVRRAAAEALTFHRSEEAFRTILARLTDGGELRLPAGHRPQALLALGYLGDLHRGEGPGVLLAGADSRLQSPLLRALESY